MDRDSVEIIDRSGRILTYMIRVLGTGDMMGFMWGLKTAIEGLPFSFAPVICDKLMHTFNNWVPSAIPGKFIDLGREYDHNCIVAVGEFGDGTLERFMERFNAFVKKCNDKQLKEGGKVISFAETASDSEVTALTAFRFVAAPAFKTFCIGEDIQGVSVDYALAKNGGMPPPLAKDAVTPLKRMRYSHFGCNVVHEDIAYALGVDTHKEKMSFKHSVEAEGGALPAEHGHGTEYHAPKNTQARWMKMDPLNVMNPGVGGLSTKEKYAK
jgi:D-lactate dehydrogenase